MQMADKPHDSGRKRHQKKKKNDPALASHFAQRTRLSPASASIQRMSALQRYGDLESLLLGVVSYAQLLALRKRFVLRGRPLFCNHALELIELFTQFGFLLCYLLLPATKRRGRSTRTTKHPHQRLAIQKKSTSATAPKIISGKERATPISNH